jgi:HlyD family secretion protein
MPNTPDNQTRTGAPGVPLPARPESPLVEVVEPRPVPSPPPPQPFTSRRRLRAGVLAAIGVIAVLIGIGLWRWFSVAPPPLHYKTLLVDRGSVVSTVTATGTVNPFITVQVGSQVTGKIKELYADFNSVVKKGQLVAQIDPALFQARVISARAALNTARGNLAKAEAMLAQRTLELHRMETLRAQQFVPQSDLDLARTNHKDAAAQVEVMRAQIDQAAAALSLAELDLGYTKIYSPEDGIVIARKVDVGQTVVASLQAPQIFLIAKDLTKMQVDTNVSESDIGGVAEGKEAEFTVDAYPNEPFRGVVSQVRNSPVSIQNVVTYDVMIDVDNRELKLKPGMTANVSIVTATKDHVLRVPNTALRFKPPGVPTEKKKSAVWTLDAQGRPRAVPIGAGATGASFTEIKEGDLREGDAVIVGLEATEAGQKELPPGFGMGPKLR